MGKSIKLSSGPPPDDENKQKETQFSVPPPAEATTGVKGQLPLPQGEVVTAIDPDKIPPAERELLGKIGWKRGQPVPASMKSRVRAAIAAAQIEIEEGEDELPEGVDPNSPPIQVDTKDIKDLDPSQQAQVQKEIEETLAAAQGTEVPPPNPMRDEMERKTRHIPDEQKPVANIKSAEDYKQGKKSDAGGANPQKNCQHCGHDLSQPSGIEPTSADKVVFAQSIMGQKPFIKSYPLLGGQMEIRFRTLTGMEIDAIYRRLFHERDKRLITTEFDFMERIARFRLYLQISQIRTGENIVELPEGLSEETNPNADGYWDFDGKDKLEHLPLVEKYVMEHVLNTEVLNRVARQQAAQFNRLVAKLEARVDDASFWKATA